MLAAGCGTESGAARSSANRGTEPPSLTPTAGSGASDGGGAPGDATTTSFRVAHFAPDLGLVDFCYRAPHGDAYVGPVLTVGPAPGANARAHDVNASDAGLAAPALGFRSVTGYIQAAGSGTFTVALVAADSHSCSAPLLEAKVTLDAGKRATIALMNGAGSDAGDMSLAAIAFVDDATPDPAFTRVRFVHAALGDATHAATGPLAASWANGGGTVTLAGDILPMHASTPSGAAPAIDALGYGATAALAGGSIRLAGKADAATVAWTSAWSDLGLAAGTVHTGFVATASPLVVVWCDDATADLAFTRCATLGN